MRAELRRLDVPAGPSVALEAVVPGPRLSVVIVTFNSREAVTRTLAALAPQLRDGDEVVVVDNASSDGSADAVAAALPAAVVVRSDENLGFAAGCNLAAERARGELLVFLNPDAAPAAGFRDAIVRPLERGWAAWMGLVMTDQGAAINTSGGVVHFTGIAWAGQAGEPVAAAPAAPQEVGFASGACFAVPAAVWREAGGFPADYFMYHEDVELSLRLRLEGGVVGVEPGARVDHEYEFEKGAHKWRRLERNRWATLLRTYPASLLLLLAPVLLVSELALFAAAVAGGWSREKLLAWFDLARGLPGILAARREIQAARVVSGRRFAEHLVPELSSPFLGGAARSRVLGGMLRAYWALVLRILR